MLSRHQRLTTATFARAFEAGRVYRHPLLQMRALRRGDAAQHHQSTLLPAATRAAFVAPKKLGPATLRNRTRRRLSEIYRLQIRSANLHFQPLPTSFDLIFLATPAALQASGEELAAAFQSLLNRLQRESHSDARPSFRAAER